MRGTTLNAPDVNRFLHKINFIFSNRLIILIEFEI